MEPEMSINEEMVTESVFESAEKTGEENNTLNESKGKFMPLYDIDKKTIVRTMSLSFIIPVIIMGLALLKVRIWPSGKFTLLIFDMQAQFMPSLASIRYLFNSDNSLLYTYFGALGNNGILNYISYFADPMTWLTVLFPLEKMPDAIYYMTVIKIGFCGLGASIYFLFGIKGKKNSIIIIALSCCYALMSYNIMYSECLMWLNVIALTPIILLGVEDMIRGKRGGLYILTMTLSMYYVYQHAYMVGIFAVLYLLYRFTEIELGKVRILIRFVICNLCCVGLFMPAFVPIILNALNGRLKTYNVMEGQFFYYPVLSVLKMLTSCQYDTIKTGGLPSIFCGTFIPMLALLLLFLPIRSVKTRIVGGMIIVLYIASFCIVPFNQFWHGFTEPNCYPCRYSYTFCLFLLILAYDNVEWLYERISGPQKVKMILSVGALAVALVELYLNAGFILSSNNIELGYKNNMEYQLYLREISDVMEHIDDDDFFRIGRDITYTSNDGMLLGYNGIEFFSSMFERNTMDLLGMLGYSQNEHMLRDYGGTPMTESLLGVKYKILNNAEDFWRYDSIYKNSSFDLELNPDALSLGFLGNQNGIPIEEVTDLQYGINEHNSFALQEYLISDLTGERVNIYDGIDYNIEEIESTEYSRKIRITFEASKKEPIWLYCKDTEGVEFVTNTKENDVKDHVQLLVNGAPQYAFMDSLSTMCTYIGEFEAGEKVVIDAASTLWFDNPWLVYCDPAVCQKSLESLKENEMTVTEHHAGHISGIIRVLEDNRALILTLPYMSGYTIKIDDTITDYGAYRDSLIAIPLSVGEHTVEISFFPPGLKIGLVICVISVILTILFLASPVKRVKIEGMD